MVAKDCGRTSISQPGEGQREEDEEGRWRKQWQEEQEHTRAEVKIASYPQMFVPLN